MSDILKVRDWLSVNEAISFLCSSFNTASIRYSDLAHLVEERKINIYFFGLSQSEWLEIDREFNSFLQPELQIQTGHTDVVVKDLMGRLSLCVESFVRYSNQSFANSFLRALEFDPSVPWTRDDQRQLIYLVVNNRLSSDIKYVAVESSWKSNKLTYKYCRVYFDEIVNKLWFKRTELETLVRNVRISEGVGGEHTEKPLASKTKNDYLRTIQALADHVVKGLTGRHSTDAQAVIVALEGKCPVEEKTLATYLKEASETPPKRK